MVTQSNTSAELVTKTAKQMTEKKQSTTYRMNLNTQDLNPSVLDQAEEFSTAYALSTSGEVSGTQRSLIDEEWSELNEANHQ